MPQALLVDDDSNILLAFAELIQQQGFDTTAVGTLAEAKAHLNTNVPDVLLFDLMLPDGNGMELLQGLNTTTQVVVITGNASVDTVVESLRMGVCDYLTKPIDTARLQAVLANILRTHRLQEEIGSLQGELRKLGHFGSLIGSSPVMQRLYDLITRVAPSDATVLLTGESGTGKEVVAQTLHDQSKRSKEPFLPLNCGAVSPNIIESELFGHERGSFTGADRLHKGCFERAHKGTIFLDEITEMPIELQVKLLRVLETGIVTRIGGERATPVDVRVIAATNRSPELAVEQGKLREDLLYRLKVFPIQLPPLRERGDDITFLAHHFLNALNKAEGMSKTFTHAFLNHLRSHNWPGNVRELKNLVHQAFILADDEIGPTYLPPSVGVAADNSSSSTPSLSLKVGIPIAEADRRLILATLNHLDGDKTKAAQILGISLKTLYNRLNEYR